MVHEIKLQEQFCEAVWLGYKPFEIRHNDRGYQKGDEVIFIPVNAEGESVPHIVARRVYEITYVISGWGLKENFVAFGIKDTGRQLVGDMGGKE